MPKDIPFIPPADASIWAKILEMGRPLMLVGPAGCGKSRVAKYIAEQGAYNFYRVNFDQSMSAESFIGATRVRSKSNDQGQLVAETFFQEGPVLKAMQDPRPFLLLDEISHCPACYISALHSFLEDIHQPFVINDDGGRVVTPSQHLKVMITSNSLGDMSDINTSLYETQTLSPALRDRLSILQVGYNVEEERRILAHISGSASLADKLCDFAKLTRDAASSNSLVHPISTRRLIAFAQSIIVIGFRHACQCEIIERYSDAQRSTISSFLTNVFGSDCLSDKFNLISHLKSIKASIL